MRQLKITNKITSRESVALDKYLSDIGKIELLTSEEEASFSKKNQRRRYRCTRYTHKGKP